MPLKFVPELGQILICDFETGFIEPEMTKARPFIILSPRRRRARVVMGVPLSSSEPNPVEPWHHPITKASYPPARKQLWAKCDMIATVSLDRLDRVKSRNRDGKRDYTVFRAAKADLEAIQMGVRSHLRFP